MQPVTAAHEVASTAATPPAAPDAGSTGDADVPNPSARNTMRAVCALCSMVDLRDKLTSLRLGQVEPLTQGGRELLRAVHSFFTPAAVDAVVKNPFGCYGFECRRGALNPEEQARLLSAVENTPELWSDRVSMLTPSIT